MKRARAFIREEDGVAMTEYAIVLGLIVGAVVLAVTTYGLAISGVFDDWGAFLVNLMP